VLNHVVLETLRMLPTVLNLARVGVNSNSSTKANKCPVQLSPSMFINRNYMLPEFDLADGEFQEKCANIARDFNPFDKPWDFEAKDEDDYSNFGAGKRRCMGRKLSMYWASTFLAKFITKFQVSIDKTAKVKSSRS